MRDLPLFKGSGGESFVDLLQVASYGVVRNNGSVAVGERAVTPLRT